MIFSFLETKRRSGGTKLDEWTLKGTVNFMAGKVPSKGTETPTVAVLAQPNVSERVGKHQKPAHNFLAKLTAKTAA